MTADQVKFLELAKYSEQLKEKQEEVRTELTAVMRLLQEAGTVFIQDPDTLAVYKIVKPNGTFMYYRDVDYIRTALAGERAGTLSKKEAESLGYILSK
jgi:hypothetical protein